MTVVHFEAEGDVAVLRLDDGRANAINPATVEALSQALDLAAGSASLVISGRPGFFSAGFDLEVLRGDAARARDLIVAAWRVYHRVYLHERPVVLAVTGHAVGFGAMFLATGDDRIAADGAWRIGLNEVSMGIAVDPVFLAPTAERLNPRHRLAALLFGETVSPAAALEAGFIDALADGDVTAAALARARQLGALPSAYGAQKHLLRHAAADALAAAIDALALRPLNGPIMVQR
jgi:enoyl-CoA hydratase